MLKAWWNKKIGTIGNCYRRGQLISHGYTWKVELYDRVVNGESSSDLAVELKEIIDARTKDLEENPPLTRDRYGHEYIDHQTRNACFSRLREKERILEIMEQGDFAPTHTIESDSAGNWLFDTVKKWGEK